MGWGISSCTISRALKKIGFTRKKDLWLPEDEAKWQAFFAELSTLLPDTIVYVDESGMDDRDQYDYAWNERGEGFHALKSERRKGSSQYDCRSMQPKIERPFYD